MKEFFVKKQSNTYAEMLEAFGLAKLLYRLQDKEEGLVEVSIESLNDRYKITSKREITVELMAKQSYYPVVPFIRTFIKKKPTVPPPGCGQTFDYIDQKKEHDDFRDRLKKVSENKNLTDIQKKEERGKINEERYSEFSKKLNPEFDVVKELVRNPYPACTKIFYNFYNNKGGKSEDKPFNKLLELILDTYSENPEFHPMENFDLTKQVTSQQIFAPHQGKGLNKTKANNPNMGLIKNDWIAEAMKISGALGLMICQYVKAGTGYDLKIYVPEIRQGNIYRWLYEADGKNGILFNFKKYLKGNTPVKLDILNLINLVSLFIEKSPEFKGGKVKECLAGLHSVYQKDLGQNKAVANISFLETPDFIEFSNADEGHDWKDWLENQKLVIRGIEEKGDAIQGLLAYRNFLSGSDLESLFSFCYWYSAYLMQALTNEKYWVRPFIINDLNKIFQAMSKSDKPLTGIIENEGFKAVAQAIRQSTVNLQYQPKEIREFGIRYGLAQELRVKSKSKGDLAKFIGDFIALYNSETARFIEDKLKEKPKLVKDDYKRANVNEDKLTAFYQLLDENPSSPVGAMLAAYGFAKKSKPQGGSGDEQDHDDQAIEE